MPDANLPKFTPEPLFLKQREQSLKLWMLLDDIDTAGDMTKGNDVLYRSLCQNIQAKRWAIMSAKEVDDAIRARGDE
jgi:hypothetical protein